MDVFGRIPDFLSETWQPCGLNWGFKMKNLAKAIRFAQKAHKDQCRDGEPALPYITHPVDVVNKLAYVGRVLDEDILCVGALHDLLEESDVTLAKIEEKFGTRIATLVNELTREEPSEKLSQTLSEEARYELRNKLLLADVKKMGPEAQVVKLADRLSNLAAAEVTREGVKLDRYRTQSRAILGIIPREKNEALWDAIDRILRNSNF